MLGLSPYLVPAQLTNSYPLGISWASIPGFKSSDAEQYAAQVNICQQATAMVDSRCNQVLRATQNTEQLYGPGTYRVNLQPTGNVRLLLSQWPILSVSAIQCAISNAFPLQWVSVANNAWFIERPPLMVAGSSAANDAGTGGQSIQMGPGYVWTGVRGMWLIETTYVAGWPHCGITQNASKGDAALYVDDCTGWAPVTPGGPTVSGVIYDTSGNQEAVSALATSAVTGPGVVSLETPLQYAHDAGVTYSALPGQVLWATALYAASLALTRGATATKIQDIAGTGGATAAGAVDLQRQADELLAPFARVV